MDDRRFDDIARDIACQPSRRALLRAALGGVGAALGLRGALADDGTPVSDEDIAPTPVPNDEPEATATDTPEPAPTDTPEPTPTATPEATVTGEPVATPAATAPPPQVRPPHRRQAPLPIRKRPRRTTR